VSAPASSWLPLVLRAAPGYEVSVFGWRSRTQGFRACCCAQTGASSPARPVARERFAGRWLPFPHAQACTRTRLCLGRSGFALAHVVLSAAGCPVPSCVLEEFPDLTQDEWDADARVTGLTLLAFEGESVREGRQRPIGPAAGTPRGPSATVWASVIDTEEVTSSKNEPRRTVISTCADV
jgi:hypothetical protein